MEREERERAPVQTAERQSSCFGLCVESEEEVAKRIADERAAAAKRIAYEEAVQRARLAVQRSQMN